MLRTALVILTLLCNVMSRELSVVRRVAVIGAGAGGLIAANTFRNDGFDVVVFEKELVVGGVWKYRKPTAGSSNTPMYKSLRTNLSKQIMAYSIADPFPGADPSFLSHEAVQTYLEVFAAEKGLLPLIRFGCTVESINYCLSDDCTANTQTKQKPEPCPTPKSWKVSTSSSSSSRGATGIILESGISEEYFDAVVICNGHYNIPLVPPIKTMSKFGGQSMHSIDYDTPDRFKGQSVLVVGSKSSGTDMAREIASVADVVFVSDRSITADKSAVYNNIHHKPVIASFESNEVNQTNDTNDGKGFVRFSDGTEAHVDIIVWCTGYAYDYPFLSLNSYTDDADEYDGSTSSESLTTVRVIDKKKVSNLYQQIFSISHPTLSFIGLPYSVVPFPLFRCQANWISSVYSGKQKLPNVDDQLSWLKMKEEEILLKYPDNEEFAIEKYHFLGEAQWPYCEFLIKSAGVDVEEQLKNLAVTKEIFNDISMSRPVYPGAPDTYRSTEYTVEHESNTWSKSSPDVVKA